MRRASQRRCRRGPPEGPGRLRLSAALLCLVLATAPLAAAAQDGNRADGALMSIGVDGAFALSPADDILTAIGLDVGFYVLSQLNVGSGLSLAFSDVATGSRVAFVFTPRLEAFVFVFDLFQLFARGGLVIAPRVGAGLNAALGLAPQAALGVRVWPLSCRHLDSYDLCPAVGLETRVLTVTSDGFLLTPRVLPEGAWVWSTGFTVGLSF